MISLVEILSTVREVAGKFPIDLTYVNTENDRMQTFNSISEYEAYKEKFIQKFAHTNGLVFKQAELEVNEIFVPLKKYVEQQIMPRTETIPNKFWISNTVTDPKMMKDFYYHMISWKEESDALQANFIANNLKILKIGKKNNPEVFLPSVKPGTMMYRGLKSISAKTKTFIKKSNWKDWKRTEFTAGSREQDNWYSHEGFDYYPHMPAQSFTYDPNVIFSGEFYDSEDSVIIAKPLDEEFYFSNGFMEWLSHGDLGNEKEAVRVAKEGVFKLIATGRTIASIKRELRPYEKEKIMRRDNPNYDPKSPDSVNPLTNPSAPETAPQ
jgi:hypothetical protein